MAWSQSNDDRLARAAGQETGSTSDQKWIATPNYARQIEAISRAARELDLDLGLGLDVGPDELESLEARILDELSD